MELITLATVRFEIYKSRYQYEAPRWTLREGDRVICYDPLARTSELEGEVVALHDVFRDGEEYNYIMDATGTTELLKIKAQIRRKDFTYPTIEEGQKETEQEETE